MLDFKEFNNSAMAIVSVLTYSTSHSFYGVAIMYQGLGSILITTQVRSGNMEATGPCDETRPGGVGKD
jgi:hypothetical protein